MSVDKAKAYYFKSGKGKLNCAQAIIAAFKERFSLDGDTVKLFAAYGSGGAPGGECGACYAAKFILGVKHRDRISECEDFFLSKAGSTKCKEIRGLKKLSCVGCVEAMAAFVDKVGGGNSSDYKIEPCAHGISLERQIRVISGSLVIAGIALGWFVHWAFLFLSLLVGCGLVYAGLTNNCLMGLLLMKLPYNKKYI